MDYQLGPGPLQVDQNTIDEKIKGDIGIVENGDVATHAIPSGYYVIWKGDLYVAKTDISSGTTLSTSNLTAKPNGLGADVAALNSKIPNYQYSSTASAIIGNYVENFGNDAFIPCLSADKYNITITGASIYGISGDKRSELSIANRYKSGFTVHASADYHGKFLTVIYTATPI